MTKNELSISIIELLTRWLKSNNLEIKSIMNRYMFILNKLRKKYNDDEEYDDQFFTDKKKLKLNTVIKIFDYKETHNIKLSLLERIVLKHIESPNQETNNYNGGGLSLGLGFLI